MKRRFISIVIVALIGLLCACSNTAAGNDSADEISDAAVTQKDEPAETASPKTAHTAGSEHKALVAYFSATGNTKTAAESIAETLDAALFEIVPAQPYSSEDLEYTDDTTRATVEQRDENARPEIKDEPEDIRQYDAVYLGYPIWWGSAPRIIYTFLEQNDLSGMKVIPFCTSGSTGIESSEEELRKAFPDIDWQPGERITDSDIKMSEWADELGFWPFGDYGAAA